MKVLTSPHLALIFKDKILSALVSPMVIAAIGAFASCASLGLDLSSIFCSHEKGSQHMITRSKFIQGGG